MFSCVRFVLLFVCAISTIGCIAEPFPCGRGAVLLDHGICAGDMTRQEVNYTNAVVEEMGGDAFHSGQHLEFMTHEQVNDLYTDMFGAHPDGNVAGFNLLRDATIYCVRNSLPHELMHTIIWIDSDGAWDGTTHSSASGWLDSDTAYVRAVLHMHGYLLREEF